MESSFDHLLRLITVKNHGTFFRNFLENSSVFFWYLKIEQPTSETREFGSEISVELQGNEQSLVQIDTSSIVLFIDPILNFVNLFIPTIPKVTCSS